MFISRKSTCVIELQATSFFFREHYILKYNWQQTIVTQTYVYVDIFLKISEVSLLL